MNNRIQFSPLWVLLIVPMALAVGLLEHQVFAALPEQSGLKAWLWLMDVLLAAIALLGLLFAWGWSQSLKRQQAAELGRRQTQHLLQTFVDNTPSVAFIKDEQGRHLMVNRAMEALLGRDRSKIIGSTDKELFADRPELDEFFHSSDMRVLQTGVVFERETELHLPDGSRRVYLEHKFPLFRNELDIYAIGGIATDISELKLTQESLEEREAHLRAVVEGSLDGIVVIDYQGTILSFNPAAQCMFGVSEEEVLGNNVNCLMPEPYRSEHDSYLSNYLQTGKASIIGIGREVEGLRSNGDSFPMDLEVTRVDVQGECRFVGIVRDVTEARAMRQELERLAITDPLTGLVNRRRFFALGEENLARARRYQRRFSVMLLDVDHFKKVNDTHGHGVGDEVLKHIAKTGWAVLRDVDTWCRYGGEEFAVMLPETDLSSTYRLAERLRQSLSSQPIEPLELELKITVSIGIAEWSEEDEGLDSILERADKQLYEAKDSGRNRVCPRVDEGAEGA